MVHRPTHHRIATRKCEPISWHARNGSGLCLAGCTDVTKSPQSGWIVARVTEVPGALSQGRTREEARENVIDALRLTLAPDDDEPAATADRRDQLDLIPAE